MTDPVIDRDGHSFERSAIEDWLNSGHSISPLNQRPMRKSELAANRALRNAIEEYVQERGGLQAIDQSTSAPQYTLRPSARAPWISCPIACAKAYRVVAAKLCVS